jgi:hypothetical protein
MYKEFEKTFPDLTKKIDSEKDYNDVGMMIEFIIMQGYALNLSREEIISTTLSMPGIKGIAKSQDVDIIQKDIFLPEVLKKIIKQIEEKKETGS